MIHDASKFLHQLPSYKDQNFTCGFSGTEVFVISYRNRAKGKEKIYTHSFRLSSISDRQSINNSESYLMSGISEEAYWTQATRISNAFGGESGNTTKNMIESVFKKYFQSQSVKSVYQGLRDITNNRIQKQLNSSETAGLHKFVIPNLTVDDTIRFLTRESDSPNKVPYFVFYEDSENFNFVNVNDILTQEPFDEYWYAHTNVNTQKEEDIIQDSKSIVGYKVNRQFDLLDNLSKGLYISKTTKIDLLKKYKKETVYDYTKYSKNFNKLQDRVVQGIAQDKEPVVTLMTTRNGHDTDNLFVSENPRPKKLDSIKDIKNSFRSAVFNTSMEVLLPANPNLKVGQVLKLNFPVDTDDAKGIEEHDKYLTGKYLITKVRQIFTKAEMQTVIECTKDGGIA